MSYTSYLTDQIFTDAADINKLVQCLQTEFTDVIVLQRKAITVTLDVSLAVYLRS